MTIDVHTAEGESDLAYAERYADVLRGSNYEWGADAETALVAAVEEMRRLRVIYSEAELQLTAEVETMRLERIELRNALAEIRKASKALRSAQERICGMAGELP